MNFEDVKDKKPKKIGELIDRSEENENYIVKVAEDKVYELAPIAYYIWTMCDGNKSVDEIVNELSKEANLDISQVRDPVVMVLDELEKASLIAF
ncbi:PqqD family protein [Saccharolobus islandicus]|uniref:Coenzyme PQQ synthesis protein D (PqqD) n=6 Tax=Saccharolobus islandicus TaxID=43080 RepID=M9U637_SACIS|nr:PqqD family protein [Sulfolobus islandicus]ACP37053.1 conserved hypothetical protein [Sulfolobus islandicus M.14.25]ACP54192.1 conserved hypothetical protein [Sulfolobus islandicus M.16.27]ACR40815.1 conserved hypothetical protein [Sulfolobus islandicus M.16.4]ADX81539.1 conserved hypothetical protein [Sulfolobus islandicus HVE10/4]ADX84257.1 conserved hypothetical protein [Sulfolobus islandicus REY15A]